MQQGSSKIDCHFLSKCAEAAGKTPELCAATSSTADGNCASDTSHAFASIALGSKINA